MNLKTQHLTRRYRGKDALSDVSFELAAGSTCLLLGHIILLSAIIAYGYAYASDLKASLNIYIGTALPVVGYILVRLALRGVQKDEELIRSTERFR